MTAEQWILGRILLGRIKVEEVLDLPFGSHANEFVFFSMKQLVERGEPVDLITLTEQLNKNGWLDRVGGAQYIAHLADGASWEE